jgi:hypothetical protein
VEVRADATKKQLKTDPSEAAVVREVFELHQGDKGIRAIADHLNRENLTYRKGRKFTSGLTHQILTREAYAGRHYFNRTDSRAKLVKERSE